MIEPTVFGDESGYFMETYNYNDFKEAGIDVEFVQDNQSSSKKGVLRGLHFQINYPQDKLVRVVSGEVFDVAVDLRKGSATYGKWYGVLLSAENKKQFFIPKNFAHGFLVLSDDAEFAYKCTDFYHPTMRAASSGTTRISERPVADSGGNGTDHSRRRTRTGEALRNSEEINRRKVGSGLQICPDDAAGASRGGKHGRKVFSLLEELVPNRRLVLKLAKNDFKTKYAGSYLGIVWAFVQPIVTIMVYWFVFSVGLKSGTVDLELPFVLYLMAGIVPWFFFQDALNGGTNR